MSKNIVNQRFIEVINFLILEKKVPSKSFLAEKFGITASKFSEILKERMNVGVDLLSVLIDDYEINAEWLLTGKGSMLKGEVKNEVVTPNNDKYIAMLEKNNALLEENKALLQEKVAKLESEIQALKSAQSKSVNKSSQPSQSQPLIRSRR